MFKYPVFFILPFIFMSCGRLSSNNQNSVFFDITTILTKSQNMDTVHFWKIIDHAFNKGKFDNKIKEQAIYEQLIKLTPEQIQQFEIIFQQMNKKASTAENMAAQTVLEGGSSDDIFYYFRCWLISLGEKNFTEILKNPDYLATLDIPLDDRYKVPNCQFEDLIPISDKAYEEVTKKDPSIDTTFPRPHAENLGLFYDSNTEITGNQWDNNNELSRIVPKLYKKYYNK